MGLFDWLVGDADKELEMVTALTYIAFADGKVDKAEGEVIDRFCSGMGFTGISKSTVQKGIQRAVEGQKPDFSRFSDKEKRQLFTACVKVARVDNNVAENENVLLVALSELMGYTHDEAVAIIKSIA